MTEELKTCDFYNEKICTLFSKYFGFNVECENVCLSTIDCDIERECPIKRLEQENKDLKKQIESDKGLITVGGKQQYQYLQKIDELEQENKELKERFEKRGKLMCNCAKQRENYRSALEEIREALGEKYGVADVIKIRNILDEVLNEQ